MLLVLPTQCNRSRMGKGLKAELKLLFTRSQYFQKLILRGKGREKLTAHRAQVVQNEVGVGSLLQGRATPTPSANAPSADPSRN